MKNWLLRALYALPLLLVGGYALSDYTATQGAGTTVFSFVCSVSKVCPASVLINSSNVEIATSGNPLRTDPTGTTTQPVSGSVTANAGTNLNTSALATQTTVAAINTATGATTDTPCTLPASATACTLDAVLKAIGNAVSGPIPLGTTTLGYTPLKLAALTNTAVAIKASGGWLGKLYCYNPNASIAYIQVYNVAQGSVTVGTTPALQSYGIPATNAAGFVMGPVGDQYSTAISVAATTTAGGGTAPGTALDCNVSFN